MTHFLTLWRLLLGVHFCLPITIRLQNCLGCYGMPYFKGSYIEASFFKTTLNFRHCHCCKVSPSIGCPMDRRYFNQEATSAIFSKNFLTNFFFGLLFAVKQAKYDKNYIITSISFSLPLDIWYNSFIRLTHYRTRGGEWRGCIAATPHFYMASVIR